MYLLSAGNGRGGVPRSSKEHELKAAFLYNFTKFVEWPPDRFADTNAPLVLGIAGDSPCRAELELIAKDRKSNGRALVIKPLQSAREVKDVHMLFVSASEDSRLDEWLASARGAAVLTAGESAQFLKRGGMINLFLEGEKIRFEINMEPADAVGLKVSAQLQKLAKAIRRKP